MDQRDQALKSGGPDAPRCLRLFQFDVNLSKDRRWLNSLKKDIRTSLGPAMCLVRHGAPEKRLKPQKRGSYRQARWAAINNVEQRRSP